MNGKSIFLTSLCVMSIACLFKSCGKYVIKNEEQVGYMLEHPKEVITEIFGKEEKSEEEKDDFERAKEDLERLLEEIKTK